MKKLPKINFGALKRIGPWIKSRIPKSKKFKVLLGVTASVLAIVLVAGLFYFIFHAIQNNRDKQIDKSINTFSSNPETTCETVIKEIGDVKSGDANKYETKVKLLENKVMCFGDQRKFDEGITAASELKSLYESKGDSANANRIENSIASLKDSKAHMEQRVKEDADVQ